MKQQAKRCRRRLREDEKLRNHIKYSLVLNVMAYTAVVVLVSSGTMSNWWANTTVSKSMIPVWLVVNTLVLTGRRRPTRGEFVKWLAYYVPSAFVGAIFLAYVIAHFGLNSIEARAVVGVMLFPLDHIVKRFVIFANGFFRKLTATIRWTYLRLKTAMA
ncbi:hypothetical protein HY379_01790 [Candidatus Saccharibacteria bacterium]|nr:hypothetical protein [Candidatus Saccharibacteria bacterium]